MPDDTGKVFVSRGTGGLVHIQVDNTDWEPGQQGLTYAYLSPDDARKLADEILDAVAVVESEPHDTEERADG